MKKNLAVILVGFCILGGCSVFASNPVFSNNQFNMSWVYNPILGTYETKTEEQVQKELEREKIGKMDFYSDNSFQKFLDDYHPLSADYSANDIVKINSDFTFNRSSDFSLRKEAAGMFEGMAWAFSKEFEFKVKLSINSARRSPTFQRQLASNCSVGRCAKPGTSEHEAGLALDLGVNGGNIKTGNGVYYQWLVDNAHKYGFHNTYQRGIAIDGKIVEPRHWRYVGVELATILHNNDKSFAEYFYQNIEARI